MKVDRIHYEQLFPTGIYANQRFRVEATVEDGDDIAECYGRLKSTVEAAFTALNPGISIEVNHEYAHLLSGVENPIPTVQVLKDPKENAINAQIEAISGCTSLKSLSIFQKLVEREGNEKLTEAYNQRKKELDK